MLKRIILFFQILLCMLPILPYLIISICCICYAGCVVANYFYQNQSGFTKKEIRYLFSQVTFFLVLAFSLFYSENKEASLNIIQHSILLCIFPIISVLGEGIRVKTLRLLSFVFVLSSLILSCYINFFLLTNYGFNYVLSGSVVYHAIKAGKFVLEIHPIYSSAFFLISILIIFDNLLKVKLKIKYLLGSILPFALLIFSIVVLASKAMIFCLVLTLVLMLVFNKHSSNKQKIVISVSIIFVLIGILQAKTLNNRLSDFFAYLKGNEEVTSYSSTSIRFQLHKCSTGLIKENFWTGLGVGDVQTVIDDCLDSYGISDEIVSVHNFYFRIMLSGGIVCLLLFLYSLFVNIKFFFDIKNLLFITILFMFLILMLFEDYLLRAYGVTLYALFVHFSFLFYKNIKSL